MMVANKYITRKINLKNYKFYLNKRQNLKFMKILIKLIVFVY